MTDLTAELPRAHGNVRGKGTIKQTPDDFFVEELLGFEPSGEGEHVFLHIEKTGENTDYLARQLARFAGVPPRSVSYAGLKDRYGRTRQWFSVQLPGIVAPDWSGFESDSVKVLDVRRNSRKLRIGAAAGNRFNLVLRDLTEESASIQTRLESIQREGVPNYFGSQRFGHEGRNLERALALFANPRERMSPHQRGLYLSAARSEIFNRILAERVRRSNWNQAIPGDAFMFSDSRTFFKPEALSEDILDRVAQKVIHASGVMWGKTPSTATDEALNIENLAASSLPELCSGLILLGIETARRPFRLCPEDMTWTFRQPGILTLSFVLPTGAFATVVAREIAEIGTLHD